MMRVEIKFASKVTLFGLILLIKFNLKTNKQTKNILFLALQISLIASLFLLVCMYLLMEIQNVYMWHLIKRSIKLSNTHLFIFYFFLLGKKLARPTISHQQYILLFIKENKHHIYFDN